ncbi:MAG TPA: DUF4351 domain-containing protein [Nannocystis sp.]
MQTLAEMWEHQGFERGFARGFKEGKREALRRLLRWRFGELPASVLARIEQADELALKRWAEALLDASNLDALFSSPAA